MRISRVLTRPVVLGAVAVALFLSGGIVGYAMWHLAGAGGSSRTAVGAHASVAAEASLDASPTAPASSGNTPNAIVSLAPASSQQPGDPMCPSASPSTAPSGYEIPVASAMGAYVAYDGGQHQPLLFDAGPCGELTAWRWDGSGWNRIDSGPPGLNERFSDVVYDPAIGKVVLLGRSGVWSWSGTSWSKVSDAVPSASRAMEAKLIYDGARRQLLALLIANSGSPIQTYGFDGTAWRLLDQAGPPGWPSYSAAYDPRNGSVLLIGGSNNGVIPIKATWSWDGKTWKELHPTTVPDGGFSNLAYDEADQQLVLVQSNGQFTASWTWDGGNWTPIAGLAPPAAGYSKMVFDAARNYLLLFTSEPGYDPPSQTWTYSGGQWRRMN